MTFFDRAYNTFLVKCSALEAMHSCSGVVIEGGYGVRLCIFGMDDCKVFKRKKATFDALQLSAPMSNIES